MPVEAERQGKTVITTEMGGGEPVSAEVHRITQHGLRNVLVHFGVIEGKKTTRAEQNLPPTRWVQALSRDDYRFAPESGIYETLLPLGHRSDRRPTGGTGAFSGTTRSRADRRSWPTRPACCLATRGPSLVAQGDCVACIAHDVDRPVE